MKDCFSFINRAPVHNNKNTQAMREKTKVYDMKLLRRAQEDVEDEAPGGPSDNRSPPSL